MRGSDLAFNLNYMRARFFAIEAAELVQDLTRRLDLVAYDPQSGAVGQPLERMRVDLAIRPGSR